MQYQTQDNMNYIVQNNSNQMVIDSGNGATMQQASSDFEWLNLMNQESQQPQQWQQHVQRRPRANTIATAQIPHTQAQYQIINQPQVINQQQQMINQQQIINQQQQQIMGQQQQIVSQPTTIIINQTQPTTQQPILATTQQPILVQQAQPAHIIVQQTAQPILVQTSPQTPTQQIVVQESIPVTTQNSQFTIIAQQGRQRANTIPGSTAPPYPPQNTTSSSPYSSSTPTKPTVSTPPAGKIAISSNHTKSIPAAINPVPMMNFPNKLSRDLFTQSEHLRKLDEELDKVDFDDVTVYELKELLRKRGLPSSGKKAILTERLLDEKRNAETRKRNYLEAEELRKKGNLNMNGLCGSNQIMDLYGGIAALTTQDIPVQSSVIASPTSPVPIMPMNVSHVKTRQRSYSDSRLTRPHIMENSPSSQLKNQISFHDYNAMETDTTTVVTTPNQTVAFASPSNTLQQVSVQPQSVVYTQQPQQNYIQIQSTDASWNQNNTMIIAQNEVAIAYKPMANAY